MHVHIQHKDEGRLNGLVPRTELVNKLNICNVKWAMRKALSVSLTEYIRILFCLRCGVVTSTLHHFMKEGPTQCVCTILTMN